MSKAPRKELVTIDGANVTLERPRPPVADVRVSGGKELFQFIDILDPKFRPGNTDKADGAPLVLAPFDPVSLHRLHYPERTR